MKRAPSYYQVTPEEDAHAFVARWLEGASWEVAPRALECHLIYFNMMRYIFRLPHKGETQSETLDDIAQAIGCLDTLRDVIIADCATAEGTRVARGVSQ